MHNETRTRKLICPFCPRTFHNIANLKQHILKGSCSNKTKNEKVPWGDIVMHNRAQGETIDNNKTDRDRGMFGRMELLFGRIKVTNQAEGVVWECNICEKTTDTKEKLRNHLSAIHRETNTGKVYCPYCKKEQTLIGNLKDHITGFIGKMQQNPNRENWPRNLGRYNRNKSTTRLNNEKKRRR